MAESTPNRVHSDYEGLLKILHPDTLVGASLIFVLFLIAGVIFSRLISHGLKVMIDKDTEGRIDKLSATFLGRLARMVMWVFVFMLYAHTIPALSKLGTALLASVSVASVVIGLAAQSTLGNLISGFSLILYKPFRLGDRLQLNAPTGLETAVVENVSLGYTILRTYDNRRIVLSNSAISNMVMVNLTSVEARIMVVIPISIGYESDIDMARDIATKLASEHPNIEEFVGCPVTALGASSIDFTLRAWCPDAGVAAQVKNDLFEAIKKSFDDHGIEIPYGYQNVIVSQKETPSNTVQKDTTRRLKGQ